MDTDIKILVVDDFETMREILVNQLLELGFDRPLEAGDGAAALQLLQENDCDLLITDRNMPGMDGIQLVRAIREDPQLAEMPVLMVTSEARRSQIMEAVDVGVDSYIVKPFEPATLRQKIEQGLQKISVS